MSNIFAWAIDGKLDDLKHLRITDINEWNKLVNNIDNPASDEGITALHYAARYGRTEFGASRCSHQFGFKRKGYVY